MPSSKYLEEVVASAARTATGTSSAFGVGEAACLRFYINVTAVSGTTPTMKKFEVQDTPDGTNWYPVANYTTAVPTGSNMPQGMLAKTGAGARNH
jgi:hypothetical protein